MKKRRGWLLTAAGLAAVMAAALTLAYQSRMLLPGAAAAQRATISEKSYGSSKRKWREWHMRNNRLLPYETIVQAASGEPEAVGTVLQYYRRRIQCAARVNGRVDQDTEDYITQTLLTAIFKFRFGR